jgi:hypothetical protein
MMQACALPPYMKGLKTKVPRNSCFSLTSKFRGSKASAHIHSSAAMAEFGSGIHGGRAVAATDRLVRGRARIDDERVIGRSVDGPQLPDLPK